MANYRQIHTKIWKDGWFLDLPAEYKLLFIYLFGNDRANLIGLYDISLKVICFETDLDQDTVETALLRFEADGKVIYRDGWVWVKNLLRYNARNIASEKIQAHICNVLDELPDIPLKRQAIAYYGGQIRYDTLSIPNPTEQEQEQEQETDQEQEQEQQTEHSGDTLPPNAAAVVLEQVHELGVSDPKATVLVDSHGRHGILAQLVPRLSGWIAHYSGKNGVTNPIGLAITQTEKGRDPPISGDKNPPIPICPECSAHPCMCEEWETA